MPTPKPFKFTKELLEQRQAVIEGVKARDATYRRLIARADDLLKEAASTIHDAENLMDQSWDELEEFRSKIVDDIENLHYDMTPRQMEKWNDWMELEIEYPSGETSASSIPVLSGAEDVHQEMLDQFLELPIHVNKVKTSEPSEALRVQ